MAATDPYITQTDLEDRLSASTVQRIFDDNNDGAADDNPIARLCADASSKVRSWLGPVFDLEAVDKTTQVEVVRLTLDVAHALAAQRHPEYLRIDGYKLMEQAERDLKLIRTGWTNLGNKSPPTASPNLSASIATGSRRGW